MRHISPLLTAALVAGLFGGVTIDAPFTLGVSMLMSAAWAAAVLGYLRTRPSLQLSATCVLVACAGWLLGTHAVDRALNSPLRNVLEQRLGGFAFESAERRVDDPIEIEGRLLADAAPTEDGALIRIDVRRVWINAAAEAASGGVSLGVSGALQAAVIDAWRAGRVVRAPALLRRPARYLNEGVPDQERALARRGVSLVGTIKSAALVEVVADGRWWEELAAAVRARTRRALARHVAPLNEQAAAIATAVLIGDRAGLAMETETRLQEAGTYHVIAISGGNIAILAGLLLAIMAFVGVHGRAAAVVAMVALVAYGVIASGGASVLRATVMAIIYLAVRLIDQRTAAPNAIALTASAILLVNPLQVVDVGFWFTFGATIALVTAATLARPRPKDRQGTKRILQRGIGGLWLVLLATIAVELALAPIAAFVFQRVTIAGLLLNFAALPAMTVVQLCAMAIVGADAAGLQPLADWLGVGAHLGARVLVDSARLLDYAPWLTWRVAPPSPLLLGAYYAALVLTLLAWLLVPRPRLARIACASAAVMFVCILAAPDARVRAFGDGRLHLSMLDVGQGDSLLVTFPNGRRLLVDTGGVPRGTFDIGDRVVGPTLRARRLLSLDYLAVTHGDGDHVGGARSLVRDFSPREIWWGIAVAGHEPTDMLRAEAERQRAAWRTLQRGDHIEIGGVIVRLHHPPPADWERQRVRNNDSLVLELRFGRVSMLLTGDIAREVEDELTRSLDLLPLVVLKVAHHGSLTSSSHAFLSAVRPTVALIGVGRGNTYGHPAPYVMGRLHDVGAEVFRTDLDGQIDVTTDGASVRVSTFTGRRAEVR
jgi:competence protein ComEC